MFNKVATSVDKLIMKWKFTPPISYKFSHYIQRHNNTQPNLLITIKLARQKVLLGKQFQEASKKEAAISNTNGGWKNFHLSHLLHFNRNPQKER